MSRIGACLNEMQEVEFLVPYSGDPSVELKRENTFRNVSSGPGRTGITMKVFSFVIPPPSILHKWLLSELFVTVQELKDYFSSSAYGYRGLDSAPAEAGRRRGERTDLEIIFRHFQWASRGYGSCGKWRLILDHHHVQPPGRTRCLLPYRFPADGRFGKVNFRVFVDDSPVFMVLFAREKTSQKLGLLCL